ncbi:MAG: GNAT family N-acetyltransferase, partial [Planctomycetales bacterium]|nr:GNAT family N-acetyltransferase [Planctomycetales bacterium]
MAEIIEINDPRQLEDHRLAWNALLGETANGSFFQTLDWLQCYWRHFGAGQRLRVLLVKSCDRAIGIVPLVVRSEATRAGRVRVLTYPLHDWGWFYGPIGPNPAATLTAAMRHVAATRRDWDLLDLRWVDNDRLDRGRTQHAMQGAGFGAAQGVWEKTAVVETTGAWDDFLASKTSKFRNNLKRFERRVAELGDVQYVRYRPGGAAHGDDDPRWDLYDECVDVARRSWQSGATDGTTICDESVAEFFRESYALAVKHGMADLCLLRINGRGVAFAYNYVNNGYTLGIRFGYDKDLAKAGVGNSLYMRTFQDSFAR